MTERILKITLRTLVTLGNLPLLLLSLFAMRSERSTPGVIESVWTQNICILVAVVAAGNIIVCLRWRATPEVPFSILYTLFRGFLWTVNLAVLLLIGIAIGSRGDLRMFLLLLPSASALLTLVLTARQKPEQAATDEKPPNAKTEVAKHSPFAQPDVRTYYAAHYAEVDALRADYERILVDKYGLQPDFVREVSAADKKEVPPAALWHLSGKTAEQAADEFYAKLYQSSDANNPKIFTRHVDTGEALPSDYPYNSWAERNLGKTLTERLLALTWIVFLYAALTAVSGDFLVSRAWFVPAFALGVASGLPCGLWLYSKWRRGHGRFKPDRGSVPWLVMVSCFSWFFCIYVGGGYMLHDFFAHPERGAYEYREDKYPPRYRFGQKCLRVKMETDKRYSREARMCIKASDAAQLDETGVIDLVISRSWFGVGIDKYALPFGAAHGLSNSSEDFRSTLQDYKK